MVRSRYHMWNLDSNLLDHVVDEPQECGYRRAEDIPMLAVLQVFFLSCLDEPPAGILLQVEGPACPTI